MKTYPYILSDTGEHVIHEVQATLSEYADRMKTGNFDVTWYDIQYLSDRLKVVYEEMAQMIPPEMLLR